MRQIELQAYGSSQQAVRSRESRLQDLPGEGVQVADILRQLDISGEEVQQVQMAAAESCNPSAQIILSNDIGIIRGMKEDTIPPAT